MALVRQQLFSAADATFRALTMANASWLTVCHIATAGEL
jgi:hypothetical protein